MSPDDLFICLNKRNSPSTVSRTVFWAGAGQGRKSGLESSSSSSSPSSSSSSIDSERDQRILNLARKVSDFAVAAAMAAIAEARSKGSSISNCMAGCGKTVATVTVMNGFVPVLGCLGVRIHEFLRSVMDYSTVQDMTRSEILKAAESFGTLLTNLALRLYGTDQTFAGLLQSKSAVGRIWLAFTNSLLLQRSGLQENNRIVGDLRRSSTNISGQDNTDDDVNDDDDEAGDGDDAFVRKVVRELLLMVEQFSTRNSTLIHEEDRQAIDQQLSLKHTLESMGKLSNTNYSGETAESLATIAPAGSSNGNADNSSRRDSGFDENNDCKQSSAAEDGKREQSPSQEEKVPAIFGGIGQSDNGCNTVAQLNQGTAAAEAKTVTQGVNLMTGQAATEGQTTGTLSTAVTSTSVSLSPSSVAVSASSASASVAVSPVSADAPLESTSGTNSGSASASTAFSSSAPGSSEPSPSTRIFDVRTLKRVVELMVAMTSFGKLGIQTKFVFFCFFFGCVGVSSSRVS